MVVFTIGTDLPARRRAGNPAANCARCSLVFKVGDEVWWTRGERNVNPAYRAPGQLVHLDCNHPTGLDRAMDREWTAALEKAVDAL